MPAKLKKIRQRAAFLRLTLTGEDVEGLVDGFFIEVMDESRHVIWVDRVIYEVKVEPVLSDVMLESRVRLQATLRLLVRGDSFAIYDEGRVLTANFVSKS